MMSVPSCPAAVVVSFGGIGAVGLGGGPTADCCTFNCTFNCTFDAGLDFLAGVPFRSANFGAFVTTTPQSDQLRDIYFSTATTRISFVLPLTRVAVEGPDEDGKASFCAAERPAERQLKWRLRRVIAVRAERWHNRDGRIGGALGAKRARTRKSHAANHLAVGFRASHSHWRANEVLRRFDRQEDSPTDALFEAYGATQGGARQRNSHLRWRPPALGLSR
jgi:hypothetical protein